MYPGPPRVPHIRQTLFSLQLRWCYVTPKTFYPSETPDQLSGSWPVLTRRGVGCHDADSSPWPCPVPSRCRVGPCAPQLCLCPDAAPACQRCHCQLQTHPCRHPVRPRWCPPPALHPQRFGQFRLIVGFLPLLPCSGAGTAGIAAAVSLSYPENPLTGSQALHPASTGYTPSDRASLR